MRGFRLGRVGGVEIGLHYSWFLIALLVALSLAAHFQATNPQWGTVVVWAAAVLTAALFFVTLILHELSHAAVARMRGLPVRSITLFALGGVAQIEREASDARTEFWMGIAGPIASAVIGAACLAVAWALGYSPATTPTSPPVAVLTWLGYINFALAAFNMIPGFPLDGGRVLRAVVWWITGDADRATRVAARMGQLVAAGFIVLGILRFFAGAGFGGLWIAFIGWFLLSAAGATQAQLEATERLRGVRVGDVMTRECELVDGDSSVQEFVDEHLLRTGRRCFIVVEDERVAGLVTLQEIRAVERARWPTTRVRDIMQRLDRLLTVTPETSVTESLEAMARRDVHQLPVVKDGRLQGVISRGHILQLLQTRAQLNP